MKINYTLDKGAYAPEKAHLADAGLDIRTPSSVYVPAHDSAIVSTGVHIMIPEGYVGMIKSKSGLNVKHDLQTEGTVDALYTGSIVVKIYNHGNEPYIFEKGDKITQLVILPIPEVEMVEVDSLEDTERGANGFGSTGR